MFFIVSSVNFWQEAITSVIVKNKKIKKLQISNKSLFIPLKEPKNFGRVGDLLF